MKGTNLTFFRVPKDKNFTCISNHFLEDPSLSGTAKGVLAYLLSCDRKNRNDWILYKEKLIKCFSDGKDSINTALDNLEQGGYLEIRKERKGKRTKLFFTVWEIPRTDYERNFRSENSNKENLCEDFQNVMSGFSVLNPNLCAENPPLLNTYINTTTNYCEESSSSNSNNLRRVMKELGLSVSDNFYSDFKSFADSHNLTDEQSESYIRWIYETKKKSAHNINSFIYKTACMENLLGEYLGTIQRKTESSKKIFCKHCGKEQTFQEQRESCCHNCGKDYFDFSQFANIKVLQQEEYANGSDNNTTD